MMSSEKELKIVFLSNITIEHYLFSFLREQFFSTKKSVDISFVSFDEYNISENEIVFQESDIIIILLNMEDMYSDFANELYSKTRTIDDYYNMCIGQCKAVYQKIVDIGYNSLIWFGFQDYSDLFYSIKGNVPVFNSFADRLNLFLMDLLVEEDIFIDFKRMIAQIGIDEAFDYKGKYRWNAPFSERLVKMICEEIHKQYLILNGISAKCIVLDCDNVLWGGVISEDGLENVCLGEYGRGRMFQDFQRYLLSLFYHGVILTICSKNDISDVLQMFRQHSGMILKEEHIACFQVNWDNKPSNIEAISQKLNLGLNSMVFVDDEEFEIDSVKLLLPEVRTIKYEKYIPYKQLSCFNVKRKIELEDVLHRYKTYRTNEKRTALKQEYMSFDDYVDALEVKIDIHRVNLTEIKRISELSQRTNKCTNGRRYTSTELKKKLNEDNYRLYSVYVCDRFSELGLVGAMGIDGTVLDLFCLSCRALGRNVENKMKAYVYQKFQVNNILFHKTPKNQEIISFLNNN